MTNFLSVTDTHSQREPHVNELLFCNIRLDLVGMKWLELCMSLNLHDSVLW